MEELFPLLVAAGWFLLRAMSNRAKKAQQEQRRKQQAEPPSLPERYEREHPLGQVDPSQQTRLERRTPDEQAPESLGDALKRISEVLQADFEPEPISEPAPLPHQARLPQPPPIPSGSGRTSQTRPIPQGRDLSKKAISRARLESSTQTKSAEDRFEETGEVFRQVSSRPTKHAHDLRKAPSRVRFLRDKKRLREAIVASEILGPPKSKRR